MLTPYKSMWLFWVDDDDDDDDDESPRYNLASASSFASSPSIPWPTSNSSSRNWLGIVTSRPSRKPILRTQVSSQLWNNQQTNINHNLKQRNKIRTKKNTEFLSHFFHPHFHFPTKPQLLFHGATSQHRTIGFHRGGTAAQPGCQSRGRRPVACRSTEHGDQVPWAKKILLQLLRVACREILLMEEILHHVDIGEYPHFS